MTLEQTFVDAVHERLGERTSMAWPNPRYLHNPIGFFEEVLGLEVWDRQAEVINAFHDNSLTAVKAGRRVSKSMTIAGLALWTYCVYENGQALLSSNTASQIEVVLWTALRRLHAASGRCIRCAKLEPKPPRPCPHSGVIDGELGQTSKSGLKGYDPLYPRFIIGRTGKTAEALQGLGGPETSFFVDEAALLEDEFLAAIEGSLAGGGRCMLAGNPRATNNAFYRAFQAGSGWRAITIPSTDSPNYRQGRIVIPGLATREWVDKQIKKHGPQSAYVATHIKGEFPSSKARKPFTRDSLEAATARNDTMRAAGLLHVGLDPASAGTADGRNDDSVFCVRRGLRMFALVVVEKGYSEDDLLERLLELLEEYREPGEVPHVNIDAEGEVGIAVRDTFRAHLHKHPNAFVLWSIRGSTAAKRDAKVYDRQRDALVGNLSNYVAAGGGLVDDPLLLEELEAFDWTVNHKGKQKATDKLKLRKQLGRSPDRADAAQLSVWQPLDTPFEAVQESTEALPPAPPPDVRRQDRSHVEQQWDPYSSFGGRR